MRRHLPSVGVAVRTLVPVLLVLVLTAGCGGGGGDDGDGGGNRAWCEAWRDLAVGEDDALLEYEDAYEDAASSAGGMTADEADAAAAELQDLWDAALAPLVEEAPGAIATEIAALVEGGGPGDFPDEGDTDAIEMEAEQRVTDWVRHNCSREGPKWCVDYAAIQDGDDPELVAALRQFEDLEVQSLSREELEAAVGDLQAVWDEVTGPMIDSAPDEIAADVELTASIENVLGPIFSSIDPDPEVEEAQGRIDAWVSEHCFVPQSSVFERPRPAAEQGEWIMPSDEELSDITFVDVGAAHACAVDRDGGLWCWGSGVLGWFELPEDGLAARMDLDVPVTAAAAGETFSCALDADGQVWCRGGNEVGQLGDGTVVSREEWAPVVGLDGVSDVSAGGHACALIDDGTVRCWGLNDRGQLGDGTTENRSEPVAVEGLDDVIQVSAGATHTCAVAGDGRVWCWGSNTRGQLGDGTTTNRSTPVQVVGLDRVANLSAGATHTCARREDTSVWCWGRNDYGQLGDGTTQDRSTPVRVGGLSDVVDVAAGQDVSCTAGLLDVSCWGTSENPNTGEPRVPQPTPTDVSGVELPGRISASGAVCATSTGNGMVYCWGDNSNLLLGRGYDPYGPVDPTTGEPSSSAPLPVLRVEES